MTTGASDSPGTEQPTAVDAAMPARHLTINKQTVIIAVAILAVLSLVIFRLSAHANSQDGLEVQSDALSSNVSSSEPESAPAPTASSSDVTTVTTETLPKDSTNSGSVEVNLNSSTTTSSDTSQNSSSTSVTVNGQPVSVRNGRVSKRFSSSDGTMRVQIQSNNQVVNGGDAD